mgnify:CR=1 FL=1
MKTRSGAQAITRTSRVMMLCLVVRAWPKRHYAVRFIGKIVDIEHVSGRLIGRQGATVLSSTRKWFRFSTKGTQNMSFQIHSLPAERFAELFRLSDAELADRNACRQIVGSKPGTPCRVSMADAEVGETVILLNYEHQPEASPYNASHAIFVREAVPQARLAVGEVPEVLRSRVVSLRLFDSSHMMIDADVLQGDDLADAITAAFENDQVAYAHLHNAKPGCFAASVTRAG